ncbi:ABC transporter ATP-binding protein [Rhizobium jaguaris]|uniref:dipeptide ABC transporter ATP-binding protein n=1 Tax=Rhizobium jaguaris TaxID=1312183 RepID=UPI0039BF24EC
MKTAARQKTLADLAPMPSSNGNRGPILDIKNLTVRLKRLPGDVTVLDDVSYTVEHGEALAIVGESGAGKSVSTRAVLDLLDDRRFTIEGSIKLDGQELLTMPHRQRRKYISSVASLVFQDPTRALNPSMRVGAQIAEAMYRVKGRAQRYSRKEAEARALELLRAVGIADPQERFHAYPHQLSGGMRQRVVIAVAIACAPKIIFCDEPTSGLDVTTQALIMDLLQNLREQLGVAMVLITHDLSLAASRVDNVMVMYQGRLVEKLPSTGLFQNAAMPYTQALLRAMPGFSGEVPEPMPTLPYRLRTTQLACAYAPICPRVQDICRERTPPLAAVGEHHDALCFFPGPAEKTTRRSVVIDNTKPASADKREPLLICDDIVREFSVRRGLFGKGTVSAVDHVSFDIARGETLAIVGETGSGKSTLARAIMDAPKPKSGRISIAGHELAGNRSVSRKQRGELVQMVFQDPVGALDPKWTVANLIAEPLGAQGGLTAEGKRRRIAEILSRVGLSASEFGARLPRETSGGQAQRIAIARALVSSPDLVICDEPVTALDVSVQAQIIRLLFELKRDLNLTFLLIAHDLSVVRVLANRVATMYLGRFCEIGDTADIFARPAHPYSAALLSAIPPHPGDSVERPRIRLLGEPPSPLAPPSGCRFRTRCAYAQDICAKVTPKLTAHGPNRSVACHFPLTDAEAAPSSAPSATVDAPH